MMNRTLSPSSLVVASSLLCACGPVASTMDAANTDAVVTADAATSGDGSACRASASRSVLDLRYHSVDGVDPNLLSVDLYLPTLDAGCAAPGLVVYVHGGAWITGDKRNAIDAKVRYFTGQGFAFASVNYRLSPAMAGQSGVQYPVHDQDVARALAWLRDHAGMYGYRAERITLFGHSAGAGIVSLVGTDPQFLSGAGRSLADLSCVAALDTEAYDVASQVAMGGQSETIYRNAFGADMMVWTQASPLLNGTIRAGAGIPSFMVVTRGTMDRRGLSQRFADALRGAGVSVTFAEANPLTHEQVNDAIGDPNDTIVMPSFGPFIERCAR